MLRPKPCCQMADAEQDDYTPSGLGRKPSAKPVSDKVDQEGLAQ